MRGAPDRFPTIRRDHRSRVEPHSGLMLLQGRHLRVCGPILTSFPCKKYLKYSLRRSRPGLLHPGGFRGAWGAGRVGGLGAVDGSGCGGRRRNRASLEPRPRAVPGLCSCARPRVLVTQLVPRSPRPAYPRRGSGRTSRHVTRAHWPPRSAPAVGPRRYPVGSFVSQLDILHLIRSRKRRNPWLLRTGPVR